MKGMIFTNFIEMIDEVFSPEITEQLIDKVQPASGAAYTTVGSYDHTEILNLVVGLSELTGEDVPNLVRAFGHYLFAALGKAHPEYIADVASTFELLQRVHEHIHVEVRKLYPDAELPTIGCEVDGNQLTVNYQSERPFAGVAEGLIMGCIEHFGEDIALERTRASTDGCAAQFTLTRAA